MLTRRKQGLAIATSKLPPDRQSMHSMTLGSSWLYRHWVDGESKAAPAVRSVFPSVRLSKTIP